MSLIDEIRQKLLSGSAFLHRTFDPVGQSKVTQYINNPNNAPRRVAQNLRMLPKGVVTAVAAPFMSGEQLLRFNPEVTNPDYAKRIGGTFFDVATAGLGGAEIKAGLKGGQVLAKPLLKTVLTRGAEGAAYGGIRAASQGEKARQVAFNAALGGALGGATGAVLEHGVPAAIKAVRETRLATQARPDFRPGFSPGFVKVPGGEKPKIPDYSAEAKQQAEFQAAHQKDLKTPGYNDRIKAQYQDIANRTGQTFFGAKPEVNPLLAEARKYKSAEEFVKAQGNDTYFHTTTPEAAKSINTNGFNASVGNRTQAIGSDILKNNEPGVFLYKNDKSAADYFAKNFKNGSEVVETKVNGKILRTEKSPSELTREYIKGVRDRGYVGVQGKELGQDYTFVFDKNAIKTKSQLTDLYNQAKGATPEIAPGTVPVTTPETSRGLEPKTSEPAVSNLDSGQPNQLISKAKKEISPPQLEASTSLSSNEIIPPNTFYNVDRLNISDKAKKTIKTEIASAGEKISEVVGKKLSNEEVIKAAENTAGILDRTIGRTQTEKKIAENLKLRQKIAATAQKGFENKKSAEDFVDLWLKDKSAGTDIARQLQARRIVANQNEQEGIDVLLNAIYRNNKNADEILAASKKYDLSKPEEVTKFYREFVKPNAMDWIDVIRYNSMLSSPTTHIVNISSNLQGIGLIEPLTKTITGTLDAFRAALTGKPRQAFAGEGLAYYKGALSNLGEASSKLWETVKGGGSTMQEIHDIPLTEKGTVSRYVENILKATGRFLQGVDEFSTSVGEAGNLSSLGYRESKGVKVTDMGQQAFNQAKKAIFNSSFNLKEEGHMLKAVEFVPSLLTSWKNSSNPIVRTVSRFTFPFVRIGSNLLKAGISYSPLGAGTLWGATNKTEQLAKTIIGTASALGAATLLGTDRLTWAEPINEQQKNAFRAAGRQPYAVRIGDKWISYSKLHPALAFNFALISALDDSIKNKKLTEDQADTVMQTFAKFGKFIADASYLKNIGDFVSASQGSVTGWSRFASNYGQQLIPFRALMGYVERIVDPFQRQVDKDGSILEKQMQYIMAQIPWVANKVPIRTDKAGNPVINQNRVINALSPAKVTTVNPEAERGMLISNQVSKIQKDIKAQNELAKKAFELGDLTGLTPKQISTFTREANKEAVLKTLSPIEAAIYGTSDAQKLALAQTNPDLAATILKVSQLEGASKMVSPKKTLSGIKKPRRGVRGRKYKAKTIKLARPRKVSLKASYGRKYTPKRIKSGLGRKRI